MFCQVLCQFKDVKERHETAAMAASHTIHEDEDEQMEDSHLDDE